MADIAALCKRVIIIHNGRVMFDGELSRLAAGRRPLKVLHVALDGAVAKEQVERVRRGRSRLASEKFSLKVPKERTPEATSRLLAEFPVLDLSVEDPPIEDVIDQVFRQGVAT